MKVLTEYFLSFEMAICIECPKENLTRTEYGSDTLYT
jgi:hypothetical protein